MYRCSLALSTAAVAVTLAACVPLKHAAVQRTAEVPGASLWKAPTDLQDRDLFFGPWSASHAPEPEATYRFLEGKHTGVNPGMTVVDPQGREWSVKQATPGGVDSEGPVEVALSRLLSAVGYHQPPVYFLPSFTLKDDWGTRTEPGGRFRLKDETLKDIGPWSWQQNPFVGTAEYKGLLVLQMMFNATDLKTSNNSIYEHKTEDGAERWYVSRDIGAALGDTMRLAPFKGDVVAFEQHPFIIGMTNGWVDFAYNGWYRDLVQYRITPADVRWASDLMAQLSDQQWTDAFRAGGYQPEVANRFIRKLREKVAQGRSGNMVLAFDVQ